MRMTDLDAQDRGEPSVGPAEQRPIGERDKIFPLLNEPNVVERPTGQFGEGGILVDSNRRRVRPMWFHRRRPVQHLG
jgi:hypothetical protein